MLAELADRFADEAARIEWPADLPREPVFTAAELEAIGTAEALLGGASSRVPTNVLHFAFATLVWPLGFLLASLLLLVGRGRLGRSVLLEDVYLLLLGAANRLVSRDPGDGQLARERGR